MWPPKCIALQVLCIITTPRLCTDKAQKLCKLWSLAKLKFSQLCFNGKVNGKVENTLRSTQLVKQLYYCKALKVDVFTLGWSQKLLFASFKLRNNGRQKLFKH